MSIVAVIPARGGSKGIPRKNLALLAGKPLLYYTIKAALESKLIDRVMLSSDDDEIIDCAISFGLDVDYKRPSYLAEDDSNPVDAALHMVEWMERENQLFPKHVVWLQPTSPLRTANDIDGALKVYLDANVHSLTSVHVMHEHPYECVQIGDSGWHYLKQAQTQASCRQKYEQNFYFINGAIYVASIDFLKSNRCFVDQSTVFYKMDQRNGIDLDEPEDLKLAEFYLASRS